MSLHEKGACKNTRSIVEVGTKLGTPHRMHSPK